VVYTRFFSAGDNPNDWLPLIHHFYDFSFKVSDLSRSSTLSRTRILRPQKVEKQCGLISDKHGICKAQLITP